MFLKPIMLAGLGAAVIPLVLHLLSKARYRAVEWGAMMFLDPQRARFADHTRLKQAMLLLLRTAMIATLAIALARPVLRAGASTGADEARIHAIILLDRSASMGVVEDARPRFAAARQAVINVLSNLHRGDEVSLILTGDPVDPGQVQPTTDLQSVATRVGSLEPSYGKANIAAALEQVRQALAREPAVAHELYVVCDRQACSWDSANDRFAESWQKTRQSLTAPLRFFVIPVGGEESENVSVESIRLLGPPPVRDIPVEAEVHLRNYGAVPRSDLPVEILSGGQPIAHANVNLAANAPGQARLWLKFPASGSQVLSAKIQTTGMRFDDQIESAVNVLEPARVLVISGESRSAASPGAADFVRLALAPHEAAGDRGVDPASVRTIGVDDWWGISPDRDDVVILTNIGQLSDDQVRQLEQFTYGGGGIIFAPGDLTDIESANNDLYREGEGFLPASFAQGATSGKTARIGHVEADHPIFDFLRDRPGALADTTVARSLDLSDHAGDARIIASLSDGKPLLIERPYGRGRVLMFTTTLGTAWNQLPMTNVYLPLMQSAVRYLAGASLPERNLKPFEPIEMTFDRAPTEPTATITLPNGQQRRTPAVQSGQRWTLRFTETGQPGRYLVALAGNSSSYVVAASRDESDPAPLSEDRLTWLAKSLEFRQVDAQKEALAAVVTAQRTGKELHLALIGCVVLMALGEIALARMWTGKQ